MSTVHTEYGPGRIIDQETVRGRTRYKVAGEGFEVWLDQTKLGSVDVDDYDRYNDSADDRDGYEEDIHDLRHRLHADDVEDFDDPGRYSSRLAWAPFDRDNSTELPYNPDPQHRAIGTPGDDGASTIQPIHNIDADERLTPSDSISFDEGEDDSEPGPSADLFAREGSRHREAYVPPGWALSKGLDYLRERFPEHAEKIEKALEEKLGLPAGGAKRIEQIGADAASGAAIGGAAQIADNQATQAINWASPGGSQGGYGNMIQSSIHNAGMEREAWFQVLLPLLEGLGAAGAAEGAGAAAAGAGAAAEGAGAAAGGGALSGAAGSALRSLAPSAITHLMGGGDDEETGEDSDFGPGAGYGDMIQAQASYRPAGLSDKFIDLTAAVDPTDPVSMFRHDPDAYINRVGHLAEEGLNPRFAEYMDLVEGDTSIRTSAWKDVRKKAMRLKREGHVTVKDIAPNRIMASVVGDHGTYDVLILKNGGYGGLHEGAPGHAIANWHCGCEWGKWAFRRKYTYVGRLCSHAYASYLTMQSAHMKGKPRQQKLPQRTKPTRNMMFPTRNTRHAEANPNNPFGDLVNAAENSSLSHSIDNAAHVMGPAMTGDGNDVTSFNPGPKAPSQAGQSGFVGDVTPFNPGPKAVTIQGGYRTADNLQNGPKRLTPELVVNDTDDAHNFVDVTKDERHDVGPDDVVSEKDIVHFARLMRHCEVTEQPYPRQLVAFLSRYSSEADDTKADWKAQDGSGAGEYINKLRNLADSDQSDDFGNMADRVHQIQNTVEEARDRGTDASQFVAHLLTAAPKDKGNYQTYTNDGTTVSRSPGGDQAYMQQGDQVFSVSPNARGDIGVVNPQNGRTDYYTKNDGFMGVGGDPSFTRTVGPDGTEMYRAPGDQNWGFVRSPSGDVRGAEFVGNGSETTGDVRWQPNGDKDNANKAFMDYLRNTGPNAAPGKGPNPPASGGPAKPGDAGVPAGVGFTNGADSGVPAGVGFDNGTGGKGNQGQSGQAGKGGGQTSGTVSDGGRAGAENGDNSAITKKSPNIDADGNYTVQQGDTLTDIAQRTTGDMNKYQDIAKANPSIKNVDSLGVGTKVNLKDFVNDVGNNGVSGDITNPKGSTSAQSGPAAAKPGGSATFNTETKTTTAPAMQPADASAQNAGRTGGVHRANAGGGQKPSGSNSDQSAPLAAEAGGSSPGAAPATNPATGQPSSAGGAAVNPPPPAPGTDPAKPANNEDGLNNPAQANEQQQSRPGQQPASMPALNTNLGGGLGGGMGNDFSGAMDMVNTGVNAAGNIASGIGGALPGLASGIGSALSGLGSIFASKQDFDDWVRYAYPTADGEGKLEPHDHPFAGSGWPGSLDIGTSEEYADEQRPKMDDVTDLEQHDVESSMSKWQKQSAKTDGKHEYPREIDDDDEWDDEHDDPAFYRKSNHDEATDDGSDIVRAFQANLGDTALGAGAGGGSGRFDDISGAAQGFLRTAGRNYSLAEQSELIREGDKGGARNLDSLDLRGTHYEDMTTLGW